MTPIYDYCHLRNINITSECASSVVYLVFKTSFTIYNVWNAALNMLLKYFFFCSVHCWLQPTQPFFRNISSTSLPLMDAWFPHSYMTISEYHWSISKHNVYVPLKSLYSDLFNKCNDLIFFISWDCNNYGSCKWAEQLHKCRSLAISPANDHSITTRLHKCRRWFGMFCGKHGFSYLSSLNTKDHHGCSCTRDKITLENTKGAMKKRQSRETNNIRRREAKQKTHHNMCWTPLCANKHK